MIFSHIDAPYSALTHVFGVYRFDELCGLWNKIRRFSGASLTP